MFEELDSKGFAALVGRQFEIAEAGITVEVTSVDGRDLPGQDSFSVFFKGPSDPVIDQGTYTLRTPEGEEGLMFIVPIACTPEAATYEAAFSRLL